MRYCADTWFLLRLANGDPRAMALAKKVRRGDHELFIPSVVGTEVTRFFTKRGERSRSRDLLGVVSNTSTIHVALLDLHLARDAGHLSAHYGVPTVDAIVAATARAVDADRLLASDADFKPLTNHGLVQVASWAA